MVPQREKGDELQVLENRRRSSAGRNMIVWREGGGKVV